MKKILLFLFVIASCNSTSDKYGLIYDSTCNCFTTQADYIENHPPTSITVWDFPRTKEDTQQLINEYKYLYGNDSDIKIVGLNASSAHIDNKGFSIVMKDTTPVVDDIYAWGFGQGSVDRYVDSFMNEQRKLLFSISDTSKEYRLPKLGFSIPKENRLVDYDLVISLKKMYNVYDSIYPQYKFLNYRCVYNLIKRLNGYFASSNLFRCDIPYSNIKDIENFKTSYVWDRYVRNMYNIENESPDFILYCAQQDNNKYNFSTDMGYFYGDIPYINDNCNEIESGRGKLTPYIKDIVKYSKLDLQKRGGFKTQFFGINYGICKNGVILAPVFGGYIMITCW